MRDSNELMRKIPYLSAYLLLLVSLFLAIRAITNFFLLMVGQFTNEIPVFVLFGSPLYPTIWGLAATTTLLIITWLISTKVKRFQTFLWRKIIFYSMLLGITFYYTWLITAPVYNVIVPYLQIRIANLEIVNVWHGVLVGNTENLMVLLMFIPPIVVTLIVIWLFGQYSQHNETLKVAFEEFEFKSRILQKFFKIGDEEHWPDVTLGPDSETQELMIQPGKDRTLNNVIIGSIGTGKTAALVLPILNQDLHWMTKFINDFPEIYHRDDYNSEEVKGMYLNGISVIEPSNDLCQKLFQLVQAHKIPEKSVFYIDPTNPNTPNINPMQGPVDQVAEAFAMVIEGLAEGGDSGNFFFQQSERNHLKHYIYLLKLHEPDQEVTFDMLLKMYESPILVRVMHKKLKATIPKDIEQIENRDERNHWEIVKQIDKWFDMNHLPLKAKGGSVERVTEGEYRGEDAYYDAKAEYVQGLRNILNDIGANKLIRRVLFGKSNFDFDKHLEFGGVLLVNTAKGELAALSNLLGKLVLLSLQNAVFRRTPNTSNFHHILVDEFPDFIYRPFKEFPAQSRKYKTIVTVVAQTVAQLADKYGETYMHTLLGTLRHKMVYGDIPDFDAQLFSKIFGEKERFEETQSEQTVSPLQESPTTRGGNSYAKTKEAILSPSDIIFQKPFQAAVKIVANNKPIPVRQIDANFVPKEEFKEALYEVEGAYGEYWLEERDRFLSGEVVELVKEPLEVDDDEEVNGVESDSKSVQEVDEEEAIFEYDIERPVRIIDEGPKLNRLRSMNGKNELSKDESLVGKVDAPNLLIADEVKEGIEFGVSDQTVNEGDSHVSDSHVDSKKELVDSKNPSFKNAPTINEDDALSDLFPSATLKVSPKKKISKLSIDQEELLKEVEKEVATITPPTKKKVTSDDIDMLIGSIND
ncbi:type IV secretory system conjugative DNA transfer family protein [Metabacillus herbersteinensis]|uniref:Type IV secretory system conjugative DNA transfer family protein n=1 Tax=Metabacillus herbersteinensis TaxID=283816 RepID=A0ABV6GK33_9BACI